MKVRFSMYLVRIHTHTAREEYLISDSVYNCQNIVITEASLAFICLIV